jgi:molybdopterin/thiamine biosynthesis adenylyltransferase
MAYMFSNRYGRQYGLVHQEVVENLNVLIVGEGPVLPYLLLNLAFCGVGTLQGGVYLTGVSSSVGESHLKHQFLLRHDDLGRGVIEAFRRRLERYAPLFDLQPWPADGARNVIPDVTVHLSGNPESSEFLDLGRCRLFGQVGEAGIYVGQDPPAWGESRSNVLTPSLASLAAAVLAQDVLRLSNAIRHYSVVDQRIQVALRLRSPEVRAFLAAPDPSAVHHGIVARLKLGGEALDVRFVETTGVDEAIFHVLLPPDTLLSRVIVDSIEIIEEPLVKRGGLRPALHFSILAPADGGVEPPIPETLDEVSAFIVGVGGLGTWVAGLLAATPARRCRFSLVDYDDRVEEHNLNRQILYSSGDIGRAKAMAALDAILDMRRDAEVHRYPLELTEDFIRYVHAGLSFPYQDPFAEGSSMPPDLDRVSWLQGMAAGDALEAQVFISCLDNMQSRWVLNCAAHLLEKPLVNGGVNAFVGTADFIDPAASDATLVTRYGDGIKRDSGKVQCGGALPIQSIVTSNAVVASLQCLLTVCAEIGRQPRFNRLYFDGADRTIYGDTLKDRGEPDPLGIDAILEKFEQV